MVVYLSKELSVFDYNKPYYTKYIGDNLFNIYEDVLMKRIVIQVTGNLIKEHFLLEKEWIEENVFLNRDMLISNIMEESLFLSKEQSSKIIDLGFGIESIAGFSNGLVLIQQAISFFRKKGISLSIDLNWGGKWEFNVRYESYSSLSKEYVDPDLCERDLIDFVINNYLVITDPDYDWYNDLTEDQKLSIEKGLQDIKDGNVFTLEEVMNKINKKFGK